MISGANGILKGDRKLTNFTKELIQAINDWQRCESVDEKLVLGEKLGYESAKLPIYFREFATPLYRKEIHEARRLWQLLAENQLPEKFSAWTTRLDFAKKFKGDVPKRNLQGIIFKIDQRLLENKGEVVINLDRLYNCREFNAAVDEHKHAIDLFNEGIEKCRNSETEVVIKIDYIDIKFVYSLGGFSSSRYNLYNKNYGHAPSDKELMRFDESCRMIELPKNGDWWLSEKGTQNILKSAPSIIDCLRRNSKTSPRSATPSSPISE